MNCGNRPAAVERQRKPQAGEEADS
jgi:hypothetical protein